MGFFNFYKDDSDFNYLLLNHKIALENWLRGGYRPRNLMPESERVRFREYDKKWNEIYDKTGRGLVYLEDMNYSQRYFIGRHRNEIIELYSIFHKWEQKEDSVYNMASRYPFGFNEIALMYANVRVENLYYNEFIRSGKKLSKEEILKIIRNKPTLLDTLRGNNKTKERIVKDIKDLTKSDQLILKNHIGEMKRAHFANQKYEQELEKQNKAKEEQWNKHFYERNYSKEEDEKQINQPVDPTHKLFAKYYIRNGYDKIFLYPSNTMIAINAEPKYNDVVSIKGVKYEVIESVYDYELWQVFKVKIYDVSVRKI